MEDSELRHSNKLSYNQLYHSSKLELTFNQSLLL